MRRTARNSPGFIQSGLTRRPRNGGKTHELPSSRGPCKDKDDSMEWMHGIICSLGPHSRPKLSYAVLYPSEEDRNSSSEESSWQIAGIVTLLPTNFNVAPDGTKSSDAPATGCKAMEVGYIFLPEVWGRGYATESCAAMIKAYAELVTQVEELPGELCESVHKLNGASVRVAEKLGFMRVAEFKAEANLPLVDGEKSYDVVHFRRVI
ncbi:acetyltransferase (GNAT) domain-containing protein [Pochonia chlamydosporia 170]|uniref:Acetyltransferase (GNAT) domain-containing protein n=1 Tax=Pochonia chlamydosporia 170 TaxID=1380566 RepID=A0A179FZK3_METCM|nr:acetyltransferase (GNAT) domain-containing protein [Pochonia chlamydosporia 170]OAQ70648.2 acetyltransferase (GNAT) domain-containing protein [Pochonia chlamydosporia 170]